MSLAPLEQFQILQLIPINLLTLDVSITNFLLINLLALISFLGFIYNNGSQMNHLQENSFFFIPNSWQKSIEFVAEITAQLISDIIAINNEKYYPIIDEISFYLYFVSKDIFALITFLIFFSTFVFYFPNALNHPDNYNLPDPLETSAHVVPEWYFLPYYANLTLKSFL